MNHDHSDGSFGGKFSTTGYEFYMHIAIPNMCHVSLHLVNLECHIPTSVHMVCPRTTFTRRGSALIPFCNVQATFQIDVEHRNFLCIVEDLLLQQPLGGLPGEGKGVGGDLLQFWSWEMGRPGGGGHCGRWSRSGELGG